MGLWHRFKRALWPDMQYWAVAVLGAAVIGAILGVRALIALF